MEEQTAERKETAVEEMKEMEEGDCKKQQSKISEILQATFCFLNQRTYTGNS
jgi:hypothetical protein